jgi:hypothetical protein
MRYTVVYSASALPFDADKGMTVAVGWASSQQTVLLPTGVPR